MEHAHHGVIGGGYTVDAPGRIKPLDEIQAAIETNAQRNFNLCQRLDALLTSLRGDVPANERTRGEATEPRPEGTLGHLRFEAYRLSNATERLEALVSELEQFI